jgi:hypothetical protein
LCARHGQNAEKKRTFFVYVGAQKRVTKKRGDKISGQKLQLYNMTVFVNQLLVRRFGIKTPVILKNAQKRVTTRRGDNISSTGRLSQNIQYSR